MEKKPTTATSPTDKEIATEKGTPCNTVPSASSSSSMSPQTESKRESTRQQSEEQVTKLYDTYTLAFPRGNEDFSPTKRATTAAEESVTPKKKRIESLKQLLTDSSTQIDTNITSALYNVSKSQQNEATITLERTRRIVKIQQHKATALLDEMHLERSAQLQKLDALSARELFLHRENVKQASEIKALKEENLKLKSENISICEERSFQKDGDSDDELLGLSITSSSEEKN